MQARTGLTPGTADGQVLRGRSIAAMTLALGLSAAVVWEFFEWAANAYFTEEIHVGYNDTMADLAVGGLGALLAGVALVGWKSARTGRPVERLQAPTG